MKTITVQCNDKMLALLAPIEASAGVTSWAADDIRHAAVYDTDALLAVTEDQAFEVQAWWREMGPANITIELDAERIKAEGVWSYLCDEYGISTERNTSVALWELAHESAMTEVEFFNWLSENSPAP